MRDALLQRARLLHDLREYLDDRDFVEVSTPVVRGDDDGFRPRPQVHLGGERFLREAIGPALRLNLQHLPRVYEIGPCFRTDDPSQTHAPEFWMLDFYAAGEDLSFLMNTAEELVRLIYDGEISRVSVADRIDHRLGVDPRIATEEEVRQALVGALRLPRFSSTFHAVEEFISREIEPESEGRCLVLHEYPLGTEVCARLRPETTAVLDRFEVLLDRLEVIHGYQDETDADAYIKRASEIYFYNDEQRQVQEAIASGLVPADSVGLGIGIERLCMAASGDADIHTFIASQSVR